MLHVAGERILVVDDDESIADAVATALRYVGYVVTEAHDGLAALARIVTFQPDVIVLDVQLPGMDGLGVARTLRHRGTTTPILFLSAADLSEVELDPFSRYLPKPFSLDDVCACIGELLPQPAAPPPFNLMTDPALPANPPDAAPTPAPTSAPTPPPWSSPPPTEQDRWSPPTPGALPPAAVPTRAVPPPRWANPSGAPSGPGPASWPGAYPPNPPLHSPATATSVLDPAASPPRRTRRWWRAVAAVAAAACVFFAGIGVATVLRPASSPSAESPAVSSTTTSRSPIVAPSGTTVPDGQQPAEAVAATLGPAVVTLENGQGLGSGVVYDPSGLILTNAHVTAGGTSLNVQFSDGRTLRGTVLGADPEADIGVVKVDSPNLTAASLSTNKVVVGETVIAIGSPFGLPQTVTEGIVSAVDRPVDSSSGLAVHMIQTDAAINPGNSGGALADRSGEVIGVNTSIFSQSGDNNGIGFAIPIQTAKTVADKIVNGQSLDHAYLGASSKATTSGDPGAQIAQVGQGGPGATAGLRTGDIVTGIDNSAITTPGDLSAAVIAHAPGDRVTLHIQRNGQDQDLTVTLGTRPTTRNPTNPGGG